MPIRQGRLRVGSASLEMVLLLPIILVVILVGQYIAVTSLNRGEVSITARSAATQQAFNGRCDTEQIDVAARPGVAQSINARCAKIDGEGGLRSVLPFWTSLRQAASGWPDLIRDVTPDEVPDIVTLSEGTVKFTAPPFLERMNRTTPQQRHRLPVAELWTHYDGAFQAGHDPVLLTELQRQGTDKLFPNVFPAATKSGGRTPENPVPLPEPGTLVASVFGEGVDAANNGVSSPSTEIVSAPISAEPPSQGGFFTAIASAVNATAGVVADATVTVVNVATPYIESASNSIASGARETWDFVSNVRLDEVELACDLGGIVNPVFDACSILIAAKNLDGVSFAAGVIGLIPVVGDAGKIAIKLERYSEIVRDAIKRGDRKMLEKIRDGLNKIPLENLPKSVRESIEKLKKDVDEFLARRAPNNLPPLTPIDDFVDLTADRRAHILNGHLYGAGKSGKTEFPSNWDADRIMHQVSDVATDPNATRGLGKWDSPYALATRDGVEIRVDFYPDFLPSGLPHPNAGKISTAYPTNTSVNP